MLPIREGTSEEDAMWGMRYPRQEREKRNRPLVDAPYNLLKIIKSQKNRCILLITYKTILQQSLDFLRANQAWPIYLFTSSPPFAADIYTFLLKFILDKLLNVPFTS